VAGYASVEPDQQVKLYFPNLASRTPSCLRGTLDFMASYQAYSAIREPERPWMRSCTVRAHRAETATIDIVLHDHASPEARWADTARPGDILGMFGPSATFARPTPLTNDTTASPGMLLVDALTAATLPSGTPFAWPAGEAGSVRALRRHLVDDRGLRKSVIDLTGHWRQSLSQDDTPTEEGIAEVNERLAAVL
jgi:NADPH-dependent ferric siderophore reductase